MRWLIASSLLLMACGGGASHNDDARVPMLVECDPTMARPGHLDLPLTIGRSPENIFYVISGPRADPSIYVSKGDALEKRAIWGSGSTSTEYQWIIAPAVQSEAALSLLLETDADGAATQMALGTDTGKCFLSQGCGVTTPLELVTADAIVGLNLVEPATPVFVAVDVDDGSRVIVFKPDPFPGYINLPIFYGGPGGSKQLSQVSVSEYSYTKSGAQHITFTTGGKQYVLDLPLVYMRYDGGMPGEGYDVDGPGTLTVDGVEHGATKHPLPLSAGDLDALTFLCLET